MPDKKSDNNPKDKKSTQRTNTETARRIWLAGIGAYGRAFTEAQEAIKDVTGKSSEIFDELVQKGTMIEKVVEIKSKDMMDKASLPNFDMPNLDIDERIKAMRSRLTRGDDSYSALETRLDTIEAKLDKLLTILEPKKPVKKLSTKRAKTARTEKS